MSYTYRLRTDIVEDEEGNSFTVYGIEAVDPAGQILESVPDLFFDRQEAEQFVKLCIEEELCLVHLMDVAEDVLA